MYVREGTTSLRCGVAEGTKRKLKTIGFIEAKETLIDKCKYFCLDQSWQNKPQKSWIARNFPKKLSPIMSNVFEFLVLITSHLPWSVLPLFPSPTAGHAPPGPLGQYLFRDRSWSVLRRRTPLRTHLLKFLLNILSRWPSRDDLLTSPPRGNRFFYLFLKGERKESEGWAPKFSGFAGCCFNSTWTKLFSLLILHMSNQSCVQYLFLTFGLRCLSSCSFDINFLSKTEKDKRLRYTADAAYTLQMQQIHCRCSIHTADAAYLNLWWS